MTFCKNLNCILRHSILKGKLKLTKNRDFRRKRLFPMASAPDSNYCDTKGESLTLPLATTIKGGVGKNSQTASTFKFNFKVDEQSDSSQSTNSQTNSANFTVTCSDSSSGQSGQESKKTQKPSEANDKGSKGKGKVKGSKSNDKETTTQNSQSPGSYSQLRQKHSRKSEKSTKFRQDSSSPKPSSERVHPTGPSSTKFRQQSSSPGPVSERQQSYSPGPFLGRQQSSSPRPSSPRVSSTGPGNHLTVCVDGFPPDITQDELSTFFLSMYPIHRVAKLQDPQGYFTGTVSVRFVCPHDVQDFLSRDTILYDDIELSVSSREKTEASSNRVSNQSSTAKEEGGDKNRHKSKNKPHGDQHQASNSQVQTNEQEKHGHRKRSGKHRADKGRQPNMTEQDGNGQHRDTEKHRGHKDKRKEQQKKMMFEPHWPMDKVSEGLKRGQLIQGPIRINPKNYEECYIPHSDGVSDIFISGMMNRNRALNGDIVAVMLCDQEHWRVNEHYVKNLEEEAENERKSSQQESAIISEDDPVSTDQISTDPVSGYNSDPDVIVEEEEEVILQGDSVQVISDSLAHVKIGENGGPAGSKTESTCDNVRQGQSQNNKQETSQVVKQNASRTVKPGSPTPQKSSDKRKNSKKDTPQGTPKKGYVSVDDMVKAGSPVVKGLFQNGQIGESRTVHRAIQRTGKVVAIIDKKHSRASVGHIKPMPNNKNKALFCPRDSRVPRIMVPISDCPKDFLERPEDHAHTLFICRLVQWKDDSKLPFGNLMHSLGEAGQIEPETEGMLREYDIDSSEFSQEAIDSLPLPTQDEEWQIPGAELENRRDFRQQCVFTIDPATARDLDDALSIEVLDDDLFEVGVHIADVSYFLQESTVLDKVASLRATSVYLVQKVIPMLPRILCEQLCSLNPDTDRLTFSVTWKMNSAGEVFEEWFGRSVIRSCCKLSYDHAQGFIKEPDREWTVDELPPISTGFTVEDIKQRVLKFQTIAQNLRKARFDNGALRLDQVKLQFSLDKETKMPNGYSVYEQKDSNRLVEEFMLLANMAVAHKIYSTYPETALLRRHPPPQSKMADDLSDLCQNLGVPIDVSSSASFQQSLCRYLGDDEFSKARMQVLTSLCSKPMQNAKYFCTGCLDEDLYSHYALSVPLYTHFTSPIRRYADVIVHRTLAAALGYCKEPDKSKYQIQGQAEICNDKKQNAKRVEELSAELFFALFVKEAGPFEEKAMVMGVLDKAFDVFVLKLGVTKRVYCDKLDLESYTFIKEQKLPVLTLVWKPVGDNTEEITQRITIFTVLDCHIQAGELPLQWMATISRPKATG